MKRECLTPTIVMLVLSMLVGFSLLGLVYKPSLLMVLVLGLIVLSMAVALLVYAVKFDRQMRGREKAHEESTQK